MSIERLLRENPSFHQLEGQPANWAPQPDTLRVLAGLLRPGALTLETGAGQSTVAFALARTQHTCITPEAGEVERIRKYCAEAGIPESVRFLIGTSETVLRAGNGLPDRLDHVFIDGNHAFPAPILDWHFAARRLVVGGTLGVDDYPMPSVRVLHDFLCGEDEWELLETTKYTSFFRKLAEPRTWWSGQKINAAYPGY